MTVSGKGIGAKMGRSDWISDDVWKLILAVMLPENRLAVQVSLATGLRISDVLSLHTPDVLRTERPYVRDSKTGKLHRIYLPRELRRQMLSIAGEVYIFEGRLNPMCHRTREAVYKDMQLAADVVKRARYVDADVQISPHSARKSAAVRAYGRGGLEAAQAMLVHDKEHPAVTLAYAMADKVPTVKRRRRRKGGKKR